MPKYRVSFSLKLRIWMVWMPIFASNIVQHNSNILNESKKILKFKDAVMTTEKLLCKKKKKNLSNIR